MIFVIPVIVGRLYVFFFNKKIRIKPPFISFNFGYFKNFKESLGFMKERTGNDPGDFRSMDGCMISFQNKFENHGYIC